MPGRVASERPHTACFKSRGQGKGRGSPITTSRSRSKVELTTKLSTTPLSVPSKVGKVRLNRRLKRILATKVKMSGSQTSSLASKLPSVHERLTQSAFVSLDCEFVGINGGRSALGRCSVVDYEGSVLLDVYSKPTERITDYRTRWSGLTPSYLSKALSESEAVQAVQQAIKGKIVVGHALHNDFSVLQIDHPCHRVRDTAKCVALRVNGGFAVGKPVSLKRLSLALLGKVIQTRGHCSVEDARCAMELFKLVENSWSCPRDSGISALDNSARQSPFLDDKYWPDEHLVDN